jgi:hypothetical protein
LGSILLLIKKATHVPLYLWDITYCQYSGYFTYSGAQTSQTKNNLKRFPHEGKERELNVAKTKFPPPELELPKNTAYSRRR